MTGTESQAGMAACGQRTAAQCIGVIRFEICNAWVAGIERGLRLVDWLESCASTYQNKGQIGCHASCGHHSPGPGSHCCLDETTMNGVIWAILGALRGRLWRRSLARAGCPAARGGWGRDRGRDPEHGRAWYWFLWRLPDGPARSIWLPYWNMTSAYPIWHKLLTA